MSGKGPSAANLRQRFRRGTMRLRQRLAASDSRFLAYLAILGPGLIAANAGNDASGIATYSTAGAAYGYKILWVFIPMTLTLIIVQEMCVRMGLATGKGLSDLIREYFGVRWTALVMFALLIANTGVIVSEFVGIAQASELLGIPRFITVPLTALLIWWLVVKGTQKRVERVFLVMSLVFFCYIISAFLARPDWGEVASGFMKPSIDGGSGFLFTIMALIGTTVTPFMQVYVQSSVVEKEMDTDDYRLAVADVIGGTVFACMIAAFIVISTAATLHMQGITTINSAADAAAALTPVAGKYATYLFALGLFGAAMLAMGVLPLATAYSMSEALGFEKGLSHTFREAPIFLGIFTALIVVGVAVALIPGIPQIKLLLVTQSINGVLLPVLLIAIVKLSSNPAIMGEYANSLWFKCVAWGLTAVISALSVALIVSTVAGG